MCNCIEKTNNFYSEINVNVEVETYGGSEQRVVVLFRQISDRPSVNVTVTIPATYCPFCGQKYEI